jgi:hypothetical protein
MNELHPVMTDRAWVASTGPLTDFDTAVTRAIQLGMTSLVVYGPSGIGKTTAAEDLHKLLATDNAVVPWRASCTGIQTKADLPKFFRSFQREAASKTPSRPTFSMLSDEENTANRIMLSCDDLGTRRVVLFIDEAHALERVAWVALKAIVERLIPKGVHPLVLLMAEPEILERPVDLLAGQSGRSLVTRFFLNKLRYRGLHETDFEILMAHCDVATWPPLVGPTYTEYYTPTLFRSRGWRLADQAPLLWREFQNQARLLHLGPGNQEVAPRFVVNAIRLILSSLQLKPEGHMDMVNLIDAAVAGSSYVDDWTYQKLAAAENKDASKPKRKKQS